MAKRMYFCSVCGEEVYLEPEEATSVNILCEQCKPKPKQTFFTQSNKSSGRTSNKAERIVEAAGKLIETTAVTLGISGVSKIIKEGTNLTKEIVKEESDRRTEKDYQPVAKGLRRTDEEVASRDLDWPRDSASSADCHRDSLKNASDRTLYSNITGVYILWLNNTLLKVGSAEIGTRKRMQQYYGMNKYCGLREITEANRDLITVEWQDCPISKCNELESKLYAKYGKGEFAHRSPHKTADTWELLI